MTNIRVLMIASLSALGSARAEVKEPVALWYRSSEGCPDGAAFLGKLTRRAAPARLAGKGDAIDFVVTLAGAPEQSWGRVERQTSRGTVAIRELAASTCEAVADGLALTLALAIEPDAPPAHGESPTPDKAAPANPAPESPASDPPARLLPDAHATDDLASLDVGPEQGAERAPEWSVGVSGLMWTLVGSQPIWGGGPFVELALQPGALGIAPSIRVGAVATLSADAANEVEVALAGGRLEACPLGLAAGRLDARLCGGLEIAAIYAESKLDGGGQDTGLWSALLAHARLVWMPTERLGLESQVGLIGALGRHELMVDSPSRVAAQTNALGLSAGLGVHLVLP